MKLVNVSRGECKKQNKQKQNFYQSNDFPNPTQESNKI